jgi:LPXTG-motif cell wall-anchored protein
MGDITQESIKIVLIVVLLAIFGFVLTRKKK